MLSVTLVEPPLVREGRKTRVLDDCAKGGQLVVDQENLRGDEM